MSPIRQLDTLWSQEDRHNPTWTICRQFPRNRRHLCSLSRAVLLSAAGFYGRHPSFLLCFLQCRHHTIPTKWPQHSTPWWQLSKPSHSTVLVSGKGHCGLCLFWTFHWLEPVLLYFYSFYNGPPEVWSGRCLHLLRDPGLEPVVRQSDQLSTLRLMESWWRSKFSIQALFT